MSTQPSASSNSNSSNDGLSKESTRTVIPSHSKKRQKVTRSQDPKRLSEIERLKELLLTVAQLVKHRAVTREVVSSTPAGPTLRVFKKLRRKCCLCNYICKWLDSLVFSDKDDKPEVPSHNPSMFIILWDVKEPAHLS